MLESVGNRSSAGSYAGLDEYNFLDQSMGSRQLRFVI